MAEQTLETLVLKLVADSDGLRGDMQKALSAVEKSTKGMEAGIASVGKAMDSLKSIALGLAAAIGVTLSVEAFGSMIAKSLEAVDAQAKLADRMGLTTDEAAALALAADLSNTSIESVTRASTHLQRQLGEAKQGSEELAGAFAKLNIDLLDFGNLSQSQAMGMIADKLMAIDDQAVRTSLSMQLLGKGAGELDAFLRDGSQGIAAAKEQIDALGGAISRIDAANAEKVNDSWTSMMAIVTRVKDELAVQLAPAIDLVLQKAIEFTTTFIKNMGGVKNMIADTMRTILIFADGWVRTAQTIGGFLANLATSVKANYVAIAAAVEVMWNALKVIIAAYVEYAALQLSALLHKFAEVATAAGHSSESIISAAFSVGRSVNMMTEDARKGLDASRDAAKAAGQAAIDAFKNILNVDASGSKMIQDMLDGIDKLQNATAPAEDNKKGNTLGGGGAVAAESPEVKKAREDAQSKLEILRKSLMSERELETSSYLEKTEFLNGLKDEAFAFEGQRYVLLEELKTQHEGKLTDMEAKELDKRKKLEQAQLKAQLDGASTFFSNMSSLMNTNSKKLFAIGKAAAMATTIVNTAQAAMAAYAFGAEQGGPYLGAAYAAAAIAAGAVQLANISSASPGGGGSVGGGGGGVPSSSGQDPNSPNVGVRNQSTAQDLNITIQGTSVGREQLIELAQELNRLRGDGVVIGNVAVN